MEQTSVNSRSKADFRARVEEWEAQWLSPLARHSYPADRVEFEADCSIRTPFQRDRDRIVHSKAFRRLKHKTQVFVSPEGDHYRTRLTHTLEATQVSRTVARGLRLNEDLVEAIGLGHDLGHAPFGHIGEEVLDRCAQARFERHFLHNEHSLRVVDVLERDGQGLNLTNPVRDGILNHSGGSEQPATLEGKIVRLVDRIAYINHDIDDAVRAGILSESELPREEIAVLGRTGSERIDTLVHDLVENSEQAGDIVQSETVGEAMSRLRQFMFDNVYLGPPARREVSRIERVLVDLFEWYCEHPAEINFGESQVKDSNGRRADLAGTDIADTNTVGINIAGVNLAGANIESDLADLVVDYIAGMTDRFAIRTWMHLFAPRAHRFSE